jgi:hypothetical protein
MGKSPGIRRRAPVNGDFESAAGTTSARPPFTSKTITGLITAIQSAPASGDAGDSMMQRNMKGSGYSTSASEEKT